MHPDEDEEFKAREFARQLYRGSYEAAGSASGSARDYARERARRAEEYAATSDRPIEFPAMPDDLTDAKIAASEARFETKLAVLEAKTEARHVETSHKLDDILAKIERQGADISKSIGEQRAEAKANLTAVITTVMGVGVALFGLIVALVTYGDALFGRGMEVGDKLDAAAKHAVERQMAAPPKAP